MPPTSTRSSARSAPKPPPPHRPERPAAPRARRLVTRSGALGLDRPVLVGVLNATPDSFSDGGLHLDPGRAAAAAVAMVEAGAGVLDLGAESTRPGAAPVSARAELGRLLPVLEAVRRAVRVPLSIDTMKAEVAAAALEAGADIVNDVSAGRFDRAMLPLCARAGVPIVLMHMRGRPATMQRRPAYRDVVREVSGFLLRRVAAARRAGIASSALIVDPGIGFGKTLGHNLTLLAHLDAIAALGYPVLVGVSRKGFIGALCGGAPPDGRLVGTAAAVALAVARGAVLVRVHDVAAMREAVAVATAVAYA